MRFDQFYSSIFFILLLLEWKSCLNSFKKRILIYIMCNFIFVVRYKFRRISISFHVKLIHIFFSDEFDCVLRLIQVDLYLTSLFKMKLHKNEKKKIHNLNGMHVVLFSTQFIEKKIGTKQCKSFGFVCEKIANHLSAHMQTELAPQF